MTTDNVQTYVGVDPGKASGIAVWSNGSLDMALTGEYTMEGVYDFLDLIGDSADHVHVEAFTITARTIRTAVQYESLYLIGAIYAASHRFGWPVVLQRPGDVKMRFPDAALRQANIWHKSDHVRDALRHLLVPLVRDKLVDPRIFLLD